MAVRYIIGGTGKGKSELCYKQIVEEAEQNLNKNQKGTRHKSCVEYKE